MPAVLTHKTIMLLARERVTEICTVLQGKIDAGGPDVTTLDRQLLAIAAETSRIFISEPRPRTELPGILFAEPVGVDHESYPVSQYAVLGSMGPDITAFSSILSPGQDWVFDNVHKGTPDPHRELVNAQTVDFVLEFWNEASSRITTEVTDVTTRNATLDKMRAYVLGHLCHVAADVVSHPYVNDYQWELPPHEVKKFHSDVEGEMDALVAAGMLRRESTRSGQGWDLWWPSEDLPPQFFSAYDEALHRVYKTRDLTNRRKGYKEFEEHLEALGPQVTSADFVKDGYHVLRHGVVAKGYGYGYWSWWGWLSLLFVPAIVLPLATAGMPRGGNIFLKDESLHTERAWMEFVTTPLFFGLPATIGFGALLGSLTTRGVEVRYWLGMSGAIAAALTGIVTFITSETEEELHPGFSWPVLFGVPFGTALAQAIVAVIALGRGDRKGRMAVGAVFALPLLVLVAFFIFLGHAKLIDLPFDETDSPFKSGGFWISFVLWVAGIMVAWFLLPPYLRDLRIPESPKGDIVKRRFVRLFDDTTLHHDTGLAADSIPAAVYPSGRRKLARLWWTGTGDMFVRSDRFQLQFSADANGSNPQIVPAPVVPMNLAAFLKYLENTVKQPGTVTVGLLKGKISYTDDPDYDLPVGASFSDNGDGEDNPLAHDTEAVKFRQLGTTEDNSEYILYHAFKAAQSVRHGEHGPVPPERNLGGDLPITHDAETDGYEYLHDPVVAGADGSLMSVAGDLGAILSMGAATHMSSNLRDSNGGNVNKIYQVFRNWNLDRRRVNEWRTIVAGNAISEKGPTRAGYDDKMPGGTLRPANHATWQEPLLGSSQAAFDEGETTARQMGWTNVMREWMDVSRNSGQNTLANTAMKAGNPSNQALSRAMAYLFDLPDPTAAP